MSDTEENFSQIVTTIAYESAAAHLPAILQQNGVKLSELDPDLVGSILSVGMSFGAYASAYLVLGNVHPTDEEMGGVLDTYPEMKAALERVVDFAATKAAEVAVEEIDKAKD